MMRCRRLPSCAIALVVLLQAVPERLRAVNEESPQSEGFRQVQSQTLANGDLLVLGFRATGVAVVRVVDPNTGTVHAEAEGTSWRWMKTAGYVVILRGEQTFRFLPERRVLDGPLSEDDVIRLFLADGVAADRLRVLRKVAVIPDLGGRTLVCQAVIDRLRILLDERPAAVPTDRSRAVAGLRQEEYEELVRIVGRLRQPETASLLARTNTFATVGALVNVGRAAVVPILGQLSLPERLDPGLHRSRLLEALRQLASTYNDVAVDRRVQQIVIAVLQQSTDIPSLETAIAFADDLDCDVCLQLVRSCASDASFLRERVADSAASERVRKAAERVLARRIVM